VVEKEAASTRQTGTSVSVASGASIVADGSILMGAGQTIRSNITAGGGAIGIVGLGGSVGILNVNEHTSVNFDGVAWTGGDFLASAATLCSENVNAYGGQAGLVAAGAQVALLSDTGTVSATMGPDAKVERAGAVTLRAWRNFDSLKANAKGGAVGGLAGGASVANITIGGSAAAMVDGSTIGATSGSQVRDLAVQARFTADATADTIAVAGGIGSGVGNVSTVTLNPTVSAIVEGVDGKGLIGLTGDLTVDTNSTAIGHAIGEGRAYGGVGVGVNNTTATTNATTESLLQNGIGVSARNVSVIAHSNDVADANGQANAGGSLIGVTAANSTATDTSTTLAQILKTQPVNASGNVTVSATNDKSDATAEARGINAPGFAVGVSAANATATPDVFAGVTDATINAGGNVSITAKFGSSGMSGASAQAYGSVGALPAGAVLTANTSETQTVLVFATLGYFESPSRTTTSQITAGGDVTISSDLTTKSNATANNTGNGFFFSTGNAQAKASTSVSTQAFVGSGGKIKAGRTLAITASEGDTMDYVASGATGGTIPLGSATASGNLNRTPNVLVGNDVTLDADTISLLATVRSTTVNGNAAWESKGLGGNAFPHASFTLGGGVNLFVGRAALTARVVNINATDNEDVRVRSYGDVQGLGGLSTAKQPSMLSRLSQRELTPRQRSAGPRRSRCTPVSAGSSMKQMCTNFLARSRGRLTSHPL
jgi:trimeric autotransporter adhesin